VTHAIVRQTAEGDENTADSWQQTAPEARDLNQTAMADLLNTLSSLRAESFDSRPSGSGDSLDVLVRSGDAAAPAEEQVTLVRIGETAWALRPDNPDAAVIPTEEFDRAIAQFETLTADSP